MEVLYKWHPTSLFFIRVEMRWARGHPLHPLRGQGEGRRCFLDSGLIVVLFITAVYIALGTIQLYYDEVHAWWVKQGWKNVQWILKFSLFIYLVYRVYSKNIIFFILVPYLGYHSVWIQIIENSLFLSIIILYAFCTIVVIPSSRLVGKDTF